jgi:glutamate-1-semialdehyde 2,1-aminomutase
MRTAVAKSIGGVNAPTVERLLQREAERFAREHPASSARADRARASLIAGVPMPFMTAWPAPFPIFAARARGGELVDVDGRSYVDLCLGDSGAMTGHAPQVVVGALEESYVRGATHMLPTDDALWVAEELGRRFSLPYWQFALSATDANRFALRIARQLTGRQRILVFNWCYHGTVDETSVTIVDGIPRARTESAGLPFDPVIATRVVEFNDVEALEHALRTEDVACVIAEPAMTNIGIVMPDPGYHAAVRRLTEESGTLLLLDETHTICAGPGGCTAAWGLEPDLVVVGKPIAGGLPAAAYGLSRPIGEALLSGWDPMQSVTGGIGGTLAANAFSMAMVRLTLERVLTEQAFVRMIELAKRYEEQIRACIDAAGIPWHITRLGCRSEYRFRPSPPRNGSESARDEYPPLMRLMHLFALNRGVLLTPFHNMVLTSPATTEKHVDRAVAVFDEAVAELRRG